MKSGKSESEPNSRVTEKKSGTNILSQTMGRLHPGHGGGKELANSRSNQALKNTQPVSKLLDSSSHQYRKDIGKFSASPKPTANSKKLFLKGFA